MLAVLPVRGQLPRRDLLLDDQLMWHRKDGMVGWWNQPIGRERKGTNQPISVADGERGEGETAQKKSSV